MSLCNKVTGGEMEVGRAESQDVGRALRPSPAAMWPEHSLGCDEMMKKEKKKRATPLALCVLRSRKHSPITLITARYLQRLGDKFLIFWFN